MTIGFDARLYGPYHRGIGRYVEQLLAHLARSAGDHQLVVFLDDRGFEDYQPPISGRVTKIRAPYRVYSWQEQLLFPLLIGRQRIDIMHFPHFNVPLLFGRHFVVTIHDLIISHHPSSRATTSAQWWYSCKLYMYRRVIASAARRAQRIIAVSEATKADIVAELGVDPAKISVTYEGVDVRAATNENPTPLPINPPYLLYVGAAYPHKNLETLIKAFGILRPNHPSLQLALVGRQDFFYQRLQREITNAANIVFLGPVSDDVLASLYRQSAAFVFPSLQEGFGLPPLEAQAYGTPVICSNSSSLPEVLGDGALYFDPRRTAELAAIIRRLLEDQELRRALIEAGHRNISRFSWERMAQQTLALYVEVNSNSN